MVIPQNLLEKIAKIQETHLSILRKKILLFDEQRPPCAKSNTYNLYIGGKFKTSGTCLGLPFTISSVKSEQDAKEKGLPQPLPQYLQPRFQKSVLNHGRHGVSGRDFSVCPTRVTLNKYCQYIHP